jgi:hypothetical protein
VGVVENARHVVGSDRHGAHESIVSVVTRTKTTTTTTIGYFNNEDEQSRRKIQNDVRAKNS